MNAALLEPSFVRELEALRRFLEVGVRGGGGGSVTASRRGGAAEFEEHRTYTPGDDASRIDWLAYARTGQPFLKQYRTDEDAIVRVVLDGSASLDHGTPSKLDVARKIAAATAYMALASSERVGLVVESGAGVRALPPGRGRGALPNFLRTLSSAPHGGAVDLSESIRKATARGRPGLLVVVSDFFDAGPVTDALRRARAEGHEPLLVQVLTPDELAPTEGGDVAFVDSESGEVVELTLDRATIAAYRGRLAGLFRELEQFARKNRGARYVRATTVEPLVEVMRRVVGGKPATAQGGPQ